MQNKPKISVVVPVYNAEAYLDRCMRSIYNQTFTDYEIILVNDGSTDNSLEKCRAYAAADERVTVIDKENGGAGSARNAGILAARGEYLAFPDVDDWFEPEMYEELYALAKRHDYDIVFSGVNNYDQNLNYLDTVICKPVDYRTREECRKNVMDVFPTSLIFDSPCNKLYKLAPILENNVRFSNHKRCQDAMFNLDVYNAASSVVSTEKAYYNYINNDTAKVNRKFPKNYIDINVAYFSHLKELLTGYGLYEGKVKEHFDTSFVIAVYETASRYENPRWGLDRAGKIAYVRGILEHPGVWAYLADPQIRPDVQEQYRVLLSRDPKILMRAHQKEVRMEKLRQNKLLRAGKTLLDKLTRKKKS